MNTLIKQVENKDDVAYEQGYEAYCSFKLYASNPYLVDTEDFIY